MRRSLAPDEGAGKTAVSRMIRESGTLPETRALLTGLPEEARVVSLFRRAISRFGVGVSNATRVINGRRTIRGRS